MSGRSTLTGNTLFNGVFFVVGGNGGAGGFNQGSTAETITYGCTGGGGGGGGTVNNVNGGIGGSVYGDTPTVGSAVSYPTFLQVNYTGGTSTATVGNNGGNYIVDYATFGLGGGGGYYLPAGSGPNGGNGGNYGGGGGGGGAIRVGAGRVAGAGGQGGSGFLLILTSIASV